MSNQAFKSLFNEINHLSPDINNAAKDNILDLKVFNLHKNSEVDDDTDENSESSEDEYQHKDERKLMPVKWDPKK